VVQSAANGSKVRIADIGIAHSERQLCGHYCLSLSLLIACGSSFLLAKQIVVSFSNKKKSLASSNIET